MVDWNATHYLQYGRERTRPSIDLVGNIQVDRPRQIVDLGCGPGNSTAVLRSRWPSARIVGVDNSEAMIQAASREYPDAEWELGDARSWQPQDGPVDILFSNAALQWVDDHATLFPRLLSSVAPGGALAVQIPSSTYATVRRLIHEIADDSCWRDRMEKAKSALTMEPPEFYFDHLIGVARELEIWETEYIHVMPNADAIVDWISSTGLRPFLAALSAEEQGTFVERLRERVRESYATRKDHSVLYPFRRLFLIAYQ